MDVGPDCIILPLFSPCLSSCLCPFQTAHQTVAVPSSSVSMLELSAWTVVWERNGKGVLVDGQMQGCGSGQG